MRALVLLWLLHAAFGKYQIYTWNNPSDTKTNVNDTKAEVCFTSQAACSCCLMQTQVRRMEWLFNVSQEEIYRELTNAKTALNNMRASRTAFSVALNNEDSLICLGSFSNNTLVNYKHVFINHGGSYGLQTGTFIVPRTGVYSLAVTIYSGSSSSGGSMGACASLQVNGQEVARLVEQNGQDHEDSNTVVLTAQLCTGDEVAVYIPKGCFICDNKIHFNTFTGFMLYPADKS